MSRITIQKFAEITKEKLSTLLPENHPGLSITIEQIPNSAGTLATCVRAGNSDSTISITICLDNAYANYCSGGSMDDILSDLEHIFKEHMLDMGKIQLDTNKLLEWDYVKSFIAARFIHISGQSGDRYFTNRPVTELPCTDIGIVYDIDLSDTSDRLSLSPVRFSLLEKWNITMQELEKTAMKNLPELRPVLLDSLTNLSRSLMSSLADDPNVSNLAEEVTRMEPLPMYVISNMQHCHGSIAITYPGVYEKIRQIFQEDFYVLPSSVHECICMPKSCKSPKELLSMVFEINHSQLAKEDFLCDDIFELQNGKLVSVFSPEEREQIILNLLEYAPVGTFPCFI